jgi:hypothetical protein
MSMSIIEVELWLLVVGVVGESRSRFVLLVEEPGVVGVAFVHMLIEDLPPLLTVVRLTRDGLLESLRVSFDRP